MFAICVNSEPGWVLGFSSIKTLLNNGIELLKYDVDSIPFFAIIVL